MSPLQVEQSQLLDWLENRPDHQPPIPFEELVLASPLQAGQPVLMPGDAQCWYVKLRLHAAVMAAWLPPQPVEQIHISRQNPLQLIWADDSNTRREQCGALALLRDAAAGSAPSLIHILRRTGWREAAALVERYQDEDQIFEMGAGRVPVVLPSPRRLLLAVFRDRPLELAWIEELCDGADDWDSGPRGLPVPTDQPLSSDPVPQGFTGGGKK